MLSLVLGLVRQAAESLAGPAAAEVEAALSLLGLGTTAGIPTLPVDDLIATAPSALRDWFVDADGFDERPDRLARRARATCSAAPSARTA